MKKVFALIGLVILLLPSCRKGENDPLISLIPRKARVTGSWTLASGNGYSFREIDLGAHVTELESEWNFTGVDLEITETDENGTEELVYPYKLKYQLNKDNSFAMYEEKEYSASQDGEDYTETVEQSGTWKFTGGGEHKKKSQLVIEIHEEVITKTCNGCGTTTNTYSQNEAITKVIDLDRLKNREMIWKFGGRTVEGNITDTTFTEYRFIKD